jgi:putative membrane protein
MNRTLFSGFVFACVLLCAYPLLAQSPSGMAGQSPAAMPGRTVPGQPTGLNNPMDNPTQAKFDDKKFARDAALGAMIEVELGKLAAEKASRDDIKQFGQKVVDEHTKANDELKQVAGKENVAIPEALDSKHQSRLDKLSKLSGEAFDKAFVKEELKNREAEVRDFSAESQNGTDPNIKTFASNVLPALQQQLEEAKSLNKSEKNTAKEAAHQ